MKADKSQSAPEVDALLIELGNSAKAIPYYAMFRANENPVHFNGVFFTANSFLTRLEQEGIALEDRDISPTTVARQTKLELQP
ncbi:MAG: hypothetical protein AB8B55_19085 [Mariniblastus sp.]